MRLLLKYLLAAKFLRINRYRLLLGSLVSLLALSSGMRSAYAEGSRSMYPSTAPAGSSRANLEWRNNNYGGLVQRRTLLKVYANAGENILFGSSAVGVGKGDILIFKPNRVTGKIGQESIPITPDFQCSKQSGSRGVISSRAQELAGPQSISGGGNSSGYTPCYYPAPDSGVYDVVFYGPTGDGSADNGSPTGDVNLTSTANFDTNQGTSVAAWDVTVRSSDQKSTTDTNGRLFAYYYALFTGTNGRPLYFPIYPITTDGYKYKVTLRGTDPNGFLIYGNQVGFFDSDGKSILYHDIIGQDGQVSSPDGGTSLASPQYPTFLNPLDSTVLSFLQTYGTDGNSTGFGIPFSPIIPSVSSIIFAGTAGGNTSVYSTGGTFSFNSGTAGNYEIIISQDAKDFDPTNPLNATLRGVMPTSGSQSVPWSGKDNSGTPFPNGQNYSVQIKVHAGEYHFPLLDAENNFFGGPTTELLNATNPLGNTRGFYDDRGYTTVGGKNVGTPGSVICGINPPATPFSDPVKGFDTSTNLRSFGQNGDAGNANKHCDPSGSFGDTKGLDLWTYYPSNAANTVLNIVSTASNIFGTLYLDKNIDKIFNNGEPTLPANITVNLINSSTKSVVQTTQTDANGNYIFTNVADNNYTVQVDTSKNVPTGFTLETPNNFSVAVKGNSSSINFGFTGKSNLILVKRITAINGVDKPEYVHNPDPTSTDDKDSKWPTPLDTNSGISTYLRGAIDGGSVRPGDDIEYTIYFLSNGKDDATKVNICDPIPTNTTFVPTTYNTKFITDGGIAGTDKGIALALGSTTPTVYLTNVSDPPDRGRFYPAHDPATSPYCKTNTNGAVEVNITRSSDFPNLPSATTPGTPTNSYGFIRFHVKVN